MCIKTCQTCFLFVRRIVNIRTKLPPTSASARLCWTDRTAGGFITGGSITGGCITGGSITISQTKTQNKSVTVSKI